MFIMITISLNRINNKLFQFKFIPPINNYSNYNKKGKRVFQEELQDPKLLEVLTKLVYQSHLLNFHSLLISQPLKATILKILSFIISKNKLVQRADNQLA